MPKPEYWSSKRRGASAADINKASKMKDRQYRQTDTGNSRAVQKELERRAQTRSADVRKASKMKDRQYRQTDTGTGKKNEAIRKERRMKNMTPEYMTSHAQPRKAYTDAHTSHSPRYLYGTEPTKKQMEKKYGNTRQKPSLYDRANYKGQEMERKVKRKWKPSDTPSQRPDENGREWENHKYIDKVKTKSGKIRYIYEIEGGGSKQTNTGDLKKKANAQKNLLSSSNKATSRNTGRSKSSGGGSSQSKAVAWLKSLFR